MPRSSHARSWQPGSTDGYEQYGCQPCWQKTPSAIFACTTAHAPAERHIAGQLRTLSSPSALSIRSTATTPASPPPHPSAEPGPFSPTPCTRSRQHRTPPSCLRDLQLQMSDHPAASRQAALHQQRTPPSLLRCFQLLATQRSDSSSSAAIVVPITVIIIGGESGAPTVSYRLQMTFQPQYHTVPVYYSKVQPVVTPLGY